MITRNMQAQLETAVADMKALRPEYTRAKRQMKAIQEAEQSAPKLSEEEKQRKALQIYAEVTGNAGAAGRNVTTSAETLPTAAKGVRAGAEEGAQGQKIASSSAAARAPEAAARTTEKTKPNKRENEFMMNLMVLRNTLRVNAPACRERAKAAGKWTWRDIRLMLALVNKVQNAMLRTMPESRDDYYAAYAMHGHYELHIDGPVRTPRMLLVTDKHLASLAEAAMKSECIMCMREGSEVNKCQLREALLESAVPTEYQEGKWKKCEYRDAAGQLIRGEDATI